MNYFVTAVSHGTTGTKTIPCGFQPKGIRITASQRSTNSDNLVRQSIGMSDGTNQVCSSQYYDGTASGAGPQRYIDRIVSVRNRVSGTVQEVSAAHVDQSVAAWTATEAKYIVDTADSAYQYQVEVWGD